MKWLLLPIILLFAQPAIAACPDLPDRSEERAVLLDQLRVAETHRKGIDAIAALWTFWRIAPDELAQEMLDEGTSSIHIADLIRAEDLLGRLAAYCPDYAEGHNQLAFALFLQGNLEASLASIERTLELEPSHFGALSGKSMIYRQQGREALSQVILRRAVAINPWLSERHMLKPLGGLDTL